MDPLGRPVHLCHPPTHPLVLSVAASVSHLFREQIYNRWAYCGQWWWWSSLIPGWVKYSPKPNVDIELAFMRGDEEVTVHICEVGQQTPGEKRARHVSIALKDCLQRNLSKKGNAIQIRRWPHI